MNCFFFFFLIAQFTLKESCVVLPAVPDAGLQKFPKPSSSRRSRSATRSSRQKTSHSQTFGPTRQAESCPAVSHLVLLPELLLQGLELVRLLVLLHLQGQGGVLLLQTVDLLQEHPQLLLQVVPLAGQRVLPTTQRQLWQSDAAASAIRLILSTSSSRHDTLPQR